MRYSGNGETNKKNSDDATADSDKSKRWSCGFVVPCNAQATAAAAAAAAMAS